MKRRQLLTTGLVVATGLAGCNTGEPDPEPTTTPTDGATATPTPTPSPDPADAPTADGLDSYTFDIVGGVSFRGPHEEIDVTFEPASNAVVVSSSIVVGSSSCNRVGLESLLYGEATLQVAIAPERKGQSAESENTPACTADVAAEEYSLRVTFDGGLPDRVVVREPNYPEDEERVREVER